MLREEELVLVVQAEAEKKDDAEDDRGEENVADVVIEDLLVHV